jgi:hypothetical protein
MMLMATVVGLGTRDRSESNQHLYSVSLTLSNGAVVHLRYLDQALIDDGTCAYSTTVSLAMNSRPIVRVRVRVRACVRVRVCGFCAISGGGYRGDLQCDEQVPHHHHFAVEVDLVLRPRSQHPFRLKEG